VKTGIHSLFIRIFWIPTAVYPSEGWGWNDIIKLEKIPLSYLFPYSQVIYEFRQNKA
jgi:hypothetical protein